MNSTAVMEHWLQGKVNDAVAGHKSRIEYLEGFVSSLSERLDSLEKAYPDMATTKDLQKDTRADVLIDKLHDRLEREVNDIVDGAFVKQVGLEDAVRCIMEIQPVSDVALDARRYKWLREQHWSDDGVAIVANPKKNVQLGSQCYSQSLLDSFIDRELAKERQK